MTSPGPEDEESGALATNDNCNLGVLALLADPKPMNTLLDLLRSEGVSVDAVSNLQAARTTFFSAGGHDCLVIAPDVRPGVAGQVILSLGTVAPELAMATFGPDIQNRAVVRTARLASLHPSSRAGQGALLRFLRSL